MARTRSRRSTNSPPPAQPRGELRQRNHSAPRYGRWKNFASAWEHARSPHPSIGVITVYVLLAITVHQHAAVIEAALAVRLPGVAAENDGAFAAEHFGRSSRLSAEAAGAWRQVHKMCACLQTPSPPPAVTYQQMLAVRTGLEAVTRGGDAWRPAPDTVPDVATAAQLVTQLRQLVRSLEEISVWHLTAVRGLARAGQLYAPANVLHRDALSNDPSLAAARLARRLVSLPESTLSELLDAFTVADRATRAASIEAGTALGLDRPARPALSKMRTAHRAARWPAVGR